MDMEPRHLLPARSCITIHLMHRAMPTWQRSYESAANTNLRRRNILFSSAITPHTIICTRQITKETNFEILATFSVHGWKYLRRKCKVGLLAMKQHALSIRTNVLWDLNMDTKQTHQYHVPSTLYPKTRLPLLMGHETGGYEKVWTSWKRQICCRLEAKPSTSHITDTAPWSVSLHIPVRAQRLLQPVDHTALPYTITVFCTKSVLMSFILGLFSEYSDISPNNIHVLNLAMKTHACSCHYAEQETGW